MTSYFLLEASSSCSTGHVLKRFHWTWCHFSFNADLSSFFTEYYHFLFFGFFSWLMFFQQGIYSLFFLFTQYFLHLCSNHLEISQCCGEIPVHLCFNWKFTQMWQLETQFVCFYTLRVVRWSAVLLFTVYWFIFCVTTHLHIGEIRLELFCHQFGVSPSVLLSKSEALIYERYPNIWISRNISVSCLQSHSPTQGVWIKIWILAVFFNQRYELGPKAVISTCSQVVSIMLSGELSNSSDTPFCLVLKALR